jgi:phosphoribosylformylglycinamidine synthase
MVEDVSRSVSSDFKSAGDAIFVLGQTKNELGGSEYYAMKGQLGANVPQVNFGKNAALYRKLEKAIAVRLVASCHDCSDGGLAVALAECCIGGNVGAEAELGPLAAKLTGEQVLFSESAGRFVVSVKKKDEKAFIRAMRGVPCARVGAVAQHEALSISVNAKGMLAVPVSSLRDSWKKTMDW